MCAIIIYTAIVFTNDMNVGSCGFVKYRNITNLASFELFIINNYPKTKFINYYSKQTQELLLCKKMK